MYEKALNLLESSYSKYLVENCSIQMLCDNLRMALESIPFEDGKKEFLVQITNNTKSEKFFGLRVFPDIEKLEAFCKDLIEHDSKKTLKFAEITKKWKTIDNWVIEIDANVFDRSSINFTPKELVAMTLHEIGHVIYSDEPVEAFYRSYQETKLRLNSSERATQKLMYGIYMVPLSIACMQRRWIKDNDSLRLEIIADKSVVDLGYGEHLVSALGKIIKEYGSIYTNDNTYYNTVNSSVTWCNLNVSDVLKRKERLRDELYYQSLKNKSNYFKAVSITVLDTLGFKLRERYTGHVVENTIGLLSTENLMLKYEPATDVIKFAKFSAAYESLANSEIATEALFNNRKHVKVELPSQFDIDSISIEIDKITSHHDRIFVLDLIYEVLDRVTSFEEAVTRDPILYKKWINKINTMKAELEQLRQATLARKVIDKQYKFFVKYPEGYEG